MIIYDSYSTEHKNPFGAVISNENIVFCVKVKDSLETDHVNIVFRKSESKSFRLEKGESKDGYTAFSGEVALDTAGLYKYRFELVDSNGIMVFAGTDDGHTAKTGDWLPEWQLFVYNSDFYTSEIPDGAIMYQIFPDRFYKADGVDISGAKNERIIHENWNERPYCHYDYPKYKCNDFFMGNLRGIQEKLPYLKSLGVTHIYLNPIFESAENHRYCTSDYMNTDPYLGTVDDFKSLCKSAHKNDIKILIDGVFSHTGDDSIYFNKYCHYGNGGAYNDKNSPYHDWYCFKENRDKYECWWGFKTLPNVNETNEKYLEFITGENGVLTHWLRMGADGYRLDVADELPDLFLEKLRKTVKGYSPDALIIGEVWENAVTKESYGAQRKFLQGDQCDSVMNYPFLNATADYVLNGDAKKFYNAVMEIIDMYPKESVKCLMNMLSTHDTARIINRLSGAKVPPREKHADARLTKEEYALGVKRFKTAAAIQFTLPGIPCIYYGDEAGLQGFSDPSCRGTYPWGNENKELLEMHRELSALRQEYAPEFSKPIVFEEYEGKVLTYRRGKIRISVGGKSKGKLLWTDGNVIIEEMK